MDSLEQGDTTTPNNITKMTRSTDVPATTEARLILNGEENTARISASQDVVQDAASKSLTEYVNEMAQKALKSIFEIILCPETIRDSNATLSMSEDVMIFETCKDLLWDERAVMYCAMKEFENGTRFALVDFTYGSDSSNPDSIHAKSIATRLIDIRQQKLTPKEAMGLFHAALRSAYAKIRTKAFNRGIMHHFEIFEHTRLLKPPCTIIGVYLRYLRTVVAGYYLKIKEHDAYSHPAVQAHASGREYDDALWSMKEIDLLAGKKIKQEELDFAFSYATVIHGWFKVRQAGLSRSPLLFRESAIYAEWRPVDGIPRRIERCLLSLHAGAVALQSANDKQWTTEYLEFFKYL